METKSIEVPPSSKLFKDYLNQEDSIQSFFDYRFNEQDDFNKRLKAIHERHYQRARLVRVLTAFNKKYTNHKNVFENINKLENNQTVAVVGGQQAGLLTGPAYAIHKCLSIIKLAKQQEERLGVPVIPIFWIAGEDHDFDEVNHVFTQKAGAMKKVVYQKKFGNKTSVSKLTIDKGDLAKWIDEVFGAFGETEHTQDVLTEVEDVMKQSVTFVDFFAHLIHRLFSHYGLVLLDSADPEMRQLESVNFQNLLSHHREINESVMTRLDALKDRGYDVNLDQTPGSVNLFYEHEGSRELLRTDKDQLVGKNGSVSFDLDEISQIAEQKPQSFSNNVVTRPIMQDLLLPTLAFIAGPGEIAYWSTLREAFHCLAIDMPVVVPRLQITLIERRTDKWLEDKGVSIEAILNGGLHDLKDQWLRSQHPWDVTGVVDEFRQKIKVGHGPVKSLAVDISRGLEQVSDKNLSIIEQHIDMIEKKMKTMIEKQYDTELRRFDDVEAALVPMGQPQERIWSIFYFINQHGFELIDQLLEQDYQFDGYQNVIKV